MKCPECSHELDGDVCIFCGLVIEDHPLYHEYYEKGKEEEKPKDFIIPFGPDISYETRPAEKSTNPELNRALRMNYMSNGNGKKGQYYAIYVDIKRICAMLNLSDLIFLDAMNIYTEVCEKGLLMSLGRYPAASACVIIASRVNKKPLSFNAVLEFSSETADKVRYAYLTIIRELNLKIDPLQLQDYIIFYANKFNMGHSDLVQALLIGDRLLRVKNIDGKKLSGYAVAIIKEIMDLTANEIKSKVKISDPTIYSRHKEIRKLIYDYE